MEKTMAVSVKWLGAAFTAVLLAAVLIASPALAQAQGGNVNVQYIDCSQVQAAAANQGQYGVAVGDGATADLAQELNITQEQVNACLGGIGDQDRDKTTTEETTTEGTIAAARTDVISSSIPKKAVLAATGGPASVTGIAGCILLGAGLLLGGWVRRDR